MSKPKTDDLAPVADNGLLSRRLFLAGGTAGLSLLRALPLSAQQNVPEWMKAPGSPLRPYGERSPHESAVQRIVAPMPGTTGSGSSRAPLEFLEGMITPNSLHFERNHSGVPDIRPAQHRLVIHGLVRRPLTFDLDTLVRYPLISRVHFIECSGNSTALYAATPPQAGAGALHGLVSCAEWTGVPLGTLLDEVGVHPNGKWLLAEGADAAAMSRSVPMGKALDDAMIAVYQNGERLRPENGYPMRLLLPGWEGNTNVKWLRRLKVTAEPLMTKDETSKYTDMMPDGTALQFTFPMGVKSVITSPSGGLKMQGPGLYQISGIAWSGAGRIGRVDVSADGGKTWAPAALSAPVLTKALTRFRMAWQWNGRPAVLVSRAIDETGAVQPTRDALVGKRGAAYRYHYHALQSWAVSTAGEVQNVYV
ncbi:MAG: sulfite dehydrogenase [Vicinamibacterales bacterium]